MQHVNIWKIWKIQWTNILKWSMYEVTKSCISKRFLYNRILKFTQFTHMISDTIWQLTVKKPLTVKFWHSIKEYPQLFEKTTKMLFFFLITYLDKPGFSLNILTKIITSGLMEKQICTSICLLSSKALKRFAKTKMVKWYSFSTKFFSSINSYF